ncbi:hypothetical protein EPI10_006739 [Gossypium australe]|uniref:Uncharacterized protein n=1 Tax=Gossypium australe TaxID=47621 RepID=A0A5B6WV60_9ROSI|nr:hypothetical protein EPI10_006739 [Gossypium australe]
MVVVALANGALLAKSYKKAYEILERISKWSEFTKLIHLRLWQPRYLLWFPCLRTLLLTVLMLTCQVSNQASLKFIFCIYCEDGHMFENCPSNPDSIYYINN